jgi:hypothetical protein
MTCIIIYYLVCEAIGTAATSGLLCQPRVIMKMIVEIAVELGCAVIQPVTKGCFF